MGNMMEEEFSHDTNSDSSINGVNYFRKHKSLDFSDLNKYPLKKDHERLPLWVLPNGVIFLETFSPLYDAAYEFVISVARPIFRSKYLHKYKLTRFSLYGALTLELRKE